MTGILLTPNNGKLLGPIAWLLGKIMNGIFVMLDTIGIPNIGLSIILFTIVMYLLMMPLTVRQQKFSKLSAKMNPEIQVVQAKYKGKKDNDSMTRQNEEMQEIYKKYGVSPTGSCVQMLIQMPILFALYKVIYNMPAYVTKVKDAFFPLVDEILKTQGAGDYIKSLDSAKLFQKQDFTLANTIIDVLNKASTAEWGQISSKYTGLESSINSTVNLLEKYNYFLGLNIANSPSFIIKDAFADKSFGLIIGALLIPALAALTQWINTLFMPQTQADPNNSMASSMKTMNMMMPIMSAVFCFTLPAGMGIYWIAGSVVRSIQQVFINRHIDKMDIEKLIEKNTDKLNKKREKMGLPSKTITNNATISTKAKTASSSLTQEEKDKMIEKSTEYYNKNSKPGSIASKANMVKQYNEKNNK